MSQSKPILTSSQQIAFTDDYRDTAHKFRKWFEQIQQLYPVYSQLIKRDVDYIISRLHIMEHKALYPERFINQFNNTHYETEQKNSKHYRKCYPYR